jgi:hypothetical protein
MTEIEDGFCCPMRSHFVVGIVAQRPNVPAPVDVADFMLSFDPPIISIKFCPFCGKTIDTKNSKLRVGTRL